MKSIAQSEQKPPKDHIERMNTAVRVLLQTVDHWDMGEANLPPMLKKQA